MNNTYKFYYKVDNKNLSTKIQEKYFKLGYLWCGTGKGLWFPVSDLYFILISEEQHFLACASSIIHYEGAKELTLEKQMEFKFE